MTDITLRTGLDALMALVLVFVGVVLASQLLPLLAGTPFGQPLLSQLALVLAGAVVVAVIVLILWAFLGSESTPPHHAHRR